MQIKDPKTANFLERLALIEIAEGLRGWTDV